MSSNRPVIITNKPSSQPCVVFKGHDLSQKITPPCLFKWEKPIGFLQSVLDCSHKRLLDFYVPNQSLALNLKADTFRSSLVWQTEALCIDVDNIKDTCRAWAMCENIISLIKILYWLALMPVQVDLPELANLKCVDLFDISMKVLFCH